MMSTVRKYEPKYTVADYARWQGDWELLAGLAISMTPSPFGLHQVVAARIARRIGNRLEQCGCGCEVVSELDWIVADDTVVRPDVMVLCNGIPEEHLREPPALIVEVLSPSTASKDRTTKFDLYESQGVRHYLLADPSSQQLDAHALTAAGRYAAAQRQGSALQMEVTDNCYITIDLDGLFDSS
jgi:Uma2 family endonuclease